MIKRLPMLRGWATLSVVGNHASAQVFVAMFWWTDRYRAVTVPNYDLLGTPVHYAVTAINQLVLFCMPAFFFISGLFVTYAARGNPPTIQWKTIRSRLLGLLWPYLIWSTVMVISNEVLQRFILAEDSSYSLFTRGVLVYYFFVPLLAQYYILSPFMLKLAKTKPGLLLTIAAALQLSTVVARYLILGGISTPLLEAVAETPLWVFSRWAFYFPMGMIVGTHRRQVTRWLKRFKWWLVSGAVVLGALSILECDFIYRVTGNWDWAHDFPKLSTVLYGCVFILAFLALDIKVHRLSNIIQQVGKMSYGIYLLHGVLVRVTAKVVYHVIPDVMAFPLLFFLSLFAVGVGLPALFITLVAKSPLRKLSPYLFG